MAKPSVVPESARRPTGAASLGTERERADARAALYARVLTIVERASEDVTRTFSAVGAAGEPGPETAEEIAAVGTEAREEGISGLAHDLSEWQAAYGRFEVALRALDEFRDDHRALDRAAYQHTLREKIEAVRAARAEFDRLGRAVRSFVIDDMADRFSTARQVVR